MFAKRLRRICNGQPRIRPGRFGLLRFPAAGSRGKRKQSTVVIKRIRIHCRDRWKSVWLMATEPRRPFRASTRVNDRQDGGPRGKKEPREIFGGLHREIAFVAHSFHPSHRNSRMNRETCTYESTRIVAEPRIFLCKMG